MSASSRRCGPVATPNPPILRPRPELRPESGSKVGASRTLHVSRDTWSATGMSLVRLAVPKAGVQSLRVFYGELRGQLELEC